MALSKETGRVGSTKLNVSNTTLQVLSRMVLMNFVVLAIFKISRLNLVSMPNLLNANNCWYKQNFQNVRADLISIFNVF